jgi:hypothetical protein
MSILDIPGNILNRRPVSNCVPQIFSSINVKTSTNVLIYLLLFPNEDEACNETTKETNKRNGTIPGSDIKAEGVLSAKMFNASLEQITLIPGLG